VEWHGLNYSISNESKKSFWKRKFGDSSKDSNLETGPNIKTIIENIHGCANPGKVTLELINMKYLLDNPFKIMG
jgi:hypothetical protein